MVPTVADEHDAHAAEVAGRFAILLGLGDLSYPEWDRLAGFATLGHARQIGEGGKVPGVPKARRFAAVLVDGDADDTALVAAWLLCGTGKPPSESRARRSVAAARLKHAAKVRRNQGQRKLRARTGERGASPVNGSAGAAR